jgi:hypothetical protein
MNFLENFGGVQAVTHVRLIGHDVLHECQVRQLPALEKVAEKGMLFVRVEYVKDVRPYVGPRELAHVAAQGAVIVYDALVHQCGHHVPYGFPVVVEAFSEDLRRLHGWRRD